MLTNGGHIFFTHMVELLIFPMKFHINESSMENILYFVEVAHIAVVHIKMDTSKEKLINVHIEDGRIIHFKAYAEDLLYTNLNDPTMITNPNNVSLNAYSYLSTVKQNSGFGIDSEFEGVQKVRNLQQHLYWPGMSNFNTYLQEGIIGNCLLNPEDSVRSDHVYGLARPLLQGGMKRRRNPSKMVSRVPLPIDILLNHKSIQLYLNCFFINGMPFLHTNS